MCICTDFKLYFNLYWGLWPICNSNFKFLSLSISLSVSLCLSVSLPLCVSLSLSLCLSRFLSVSPSLCLCLSVYLSVCLSLALSLSLSLSLSLFLTLAPPLHPPSPCSSYSSFSKQGCQDPSPSWPYAHYPKTSVIAPPAYTDGSGSSALLLNSLSFITDCTCSCVSASAPSPRAQWLWEG